MHRAFWLCRLGPVLLTGCRYRVSRSRKKHADCKDRHEWEPGPFFGLHISSLVVVRENLEPLLGQSVRLCPKSERSEKPKQPGMHAELPWDGLYGPAAAAVSPLLSLVSSGWPAGQLLFPKDQVDSAHPTDTP